MKKLLDLLLLKFTTWFSSSMGVYQTFIFVTIWYLIEIIFPKVDPNSFTFLAILTYYSAITQPALAYVGKRSSEDADVVLERIAQFEERILLEIEQLKTSNAQKPTE